MDDCDRAAEREANFRADALAYANRTRDPGPRPIMVRGVAHCARCGEPIGEKRLKACPRTGLCVECAP